MINANAIQECKTLKLTFPESVKRLALINVERYYTDLVRLETIYYSQNGDTYVERLLIEDVPQIAAYFNEAKVVETIRTIQRGGMDYETFIKEIASHGCASYIVFISGRQIYYMGRKGELYIEKFPSSLQFDIKKN